MSCKWCGSGKHKDDDCRMLRRCKMAEEGASLDELEFDAVLEISDVDALPLTVELLRREQR